MESEYSLNTSTYEWSVRIFSRLEKLLGINIYLHEHESRLADGDIFLFNHFARFETFIPQYLIYKQTGAFCRSIAAAEFFRPNDNFSNFLIKLGGVPNNRQDLLPFLAREILRGRKIVLFPEGGMVKDRSVLDAKGRYSMYSSHSKKRRKQHSGAALLALALDGFKSRIRHAEAMGDLDQLERWKDNLKLASVEHLLSAAHKPTNIIPANITFYPIHIDDNFLRRSVEIFNRKKLSRRASEEIIIESNLILKNTDMDIRLGKAVTPDDVWQWWDRYILKQMNKHFINLEDYFSFTPIKFKLLRQLVYRVAKYTAGVLRDIYMHRMYSRTTINLSHLASLAINHLIENKIKRIDEKEFYSIIYLCIKHAQKTEGVYLHRSLRDPAYYERVSVGESKGIRTFLHSAFRSELIKKEDTLLVFTEKLRHEHEFDQIRLRNIISVYANEATPVKGITEAVASAISLAPGITAQEWAQHRFHDEHLSYNWHKEYFSRPHHESINKLQTASESGEPYLYLPEGHRKLGVVLVHGLLASPAELRAFGNRLKNLGYPVIGVRLAGHGTSPWDLKERNWTEWVDSVRRSYEIMSAYCDEVCLIGFSTGATASLLLAAEKPKKLAGVASVSAPVKFGNKNIVFVPLLYGLSRLFSLVKSAEDALPFREHVSHHPEINYRHIPIKTLYELRLMIDTMKKRLPEVKCPALIMHAEKDTVVDSISAKLIENTIGSKKKAVIMLPSDRHGLILEDIEDSQSHLLAFLTRLSQTEHDEHKHNSDVELVYT